MIAGYLTIAEAGARSRLSQKTIRRGLRDAHHPLGYFRIGRRVVIAEADLAAWIEGHRVTATVALAPGVLASVSPAARDLLEGFLDIQTSPGDRP